MIEKRAAQIRIGKKRVAVLISGSGSNLQALLDAAAAPEYPAGIALVISNVAQARGLERAEAAKVPTRIIPHGDFADRTAFEAALHSALTEAGIELVCLAGFMRLLTPDFVRAWAGRMINIHPSLLPLFPGLHTHRAALASGMRFHGASVHFVVPEMDAGPIILQAAVPILPEDTEASLAARTLAAEHRLYPQALRWLAEGALETNQGTVLVHAPLAAPASLLHPMPA